MHRSKYWDLPVYKRARLTHEELEAFCKVELMIQGVAEPKEPESFTKPPSITEFAKDFTIKMLAVKIGYNSYLVSQKDLDVLMKIDLREVQDTYTNGESLHSIGRTLNFENSYVDICDNPKHIEILYREKHGDAKKRQDESERYIKEVEAANAALKSIQSDWYESCANFQLFEKIGKVFSEYKTLTEGDEEMAKQFLAKRFTQDELDIYNDILQEIENNEIQL